MSGGRMSGGRFELLARSLLVQWHWRHAIPALALTILLALAGAGGSAHAAPHASTAQPRYHIFLIRGFMNIFSLGMDEIQSRLQQQGISSTVANHTEWPTLAEQAAAEYKSGRVHTIIIVGHSWGAVAVTSMVDRLGQLGVPVKLAIGLDPIWQETAAGHVGRYVNYYISNGAGEPVTKGRQFSGVMENVDVKNMPSIGHFNIDKNAALQEKIIREIRAAIYADRGGPEKPRQTQTPASPKQSSNDSTQSRTR
jgi:pimeloyl-ACP methyl ester carboxylesterase